MTRTDRTFLAPGGDTIELQWTGEDDLTVRTVNTVAHPEDIDFLNWCDEGRESYEDRLLAEVEGWEPDYEAIYEAQMDTEPPAGWEP